MAGVFLRDYGPYLGKPIPYTVYASDVSIGDNSTEADFVNNVVTIYVDTADGFGVVNAVEFGDRLILFGENQSIYN